MALTKSSRNPLSMLVLLMVCLSIVGSIMAGVCYLAVDRQKSPNPPHE